MRFLFVFLFACAVSNVCGNHAQKTHKKHGYVKNVHSGKQTVVKKARTILLHNAVQLTTINQLGDFLIGKIPDIMRKFNMDPFCPPDQTQSMAGASLELTNITVYNLTSIQRASDILVFDDAKQGKTSVGVTVRFSALELKADYKIYIPLAITKLSRSGKLTANLPALDAKVTIIADLNNVNATLDELALTMDKSQLKVNLAGSIEGLFANMAMPIIITLMQNIILEIMSGAMRKQVNSILNKIIETVHSNLSQIG